MPHEEGRKRVKACAVGRGCMGESNQRQDAPWTSGAHHTYVTAVKAEMEEGSVPTKLLLPRFSSLSGVRKMHTGECSMHRNVSPRRHRCNSETAHLASRPTSTPHQHILCERLKLAPRDYLLRLLSQESRNHHYTW